MSDRKQIRETEKVVKRVLKTAAKFDSIGKAEFEAILRKIMEQVRKNTGADRDMIAQKTDKVIQDMPREYGPLSETHRSLETMIAYIYNKYLKELGVLPEP